jgi:catechol 2,3-dioxygenase-like lactoylglutathione lyase family enzyme
MKTPPFTLGTVGHFGLSVRDPRKSADWYVRNLGMKELFEFDDGVAVSSSDVTIALHKGQPSPSTLGHISFHLPNVVTLKKALAFLKEHEVKLQDPGHEIGPEGEGSPNVALWLHDLDGYRLELSVQNGAKDL